MLEYLHVKNLALIKDIELNFSDRLNILSGETGAGKSILLGSINLALGMRADADLIRTGTDYAYVELIFTVPEKELQEKLRAMEIEPSDDRIIISRKIMDGKSQGKINGESVTSAKLRSVSELLIDIHGQHEHQSLLNEENHLNVLDDFGKEEISGPMAVYKDCYQAYRKKKEIIRAMGGDDEERKRRLDFLDFELQEIEDAHLKKGEEDELLVEHKRLSNSHEIVGGLSSVIDSLSETVSSEISRTIQTISGLLPYDGGLKELQGELLQVESLLSDIGREVSERIENTETDDEKLQKTEERLSEISRLKRKYGNSEEEVLKTYDRLQAEYDTLLQFDENKEKIMEELQEERKKLIHAAKELHEARLGEAKRFSERMTASLMDLNFLSVKFDTVVNETNRYTGTGADEVSFMISTNPGEPLKPLSKVASGGELSRIMLAIKTLSADSDSIHTLVFDEIDAGISGKTGSAVAGKLHQIAETRQVFCITHLPQIVAMADHHYLIEKKATEDETETTITELSEEGSLKELARLLGTGEVTESSLQNARELKKSIK